MLTTDPHSCAGSLSYVLLLPRRRLFSITSIIRFFAGVVKIVPHSKATQLRSYPGRAVRGCKVTHLAHRDRTNNPSKTQIPAARTCQRRRIVTRRKPGISCPFPFQNRKPVSLSRSFLPRRAYQLGVILINALFLPAPPIALDGASLAGSTRRPACLATFAIGWFGPE